MFKFVIGQVVTWKLVPGSRVIIHERVTRELPGDTIVRAKNCAAKPYATSAT